MEQSILTSIKKVLGLAEDYTAFDPDLLIHINSVFSDLAQLGVGDAVAYAIEGKEETWTDFLVDQRNINSVKSYVYLRVRLLFDPPTTSYTLTAFQEQIKQWEWRLNVEREERLSWVPTLIPIPE